MEEGKIYDRGHSNANNDPQWGTGKTWYSSVKNKITVTTYRCKICGYLESYAK